MGFNEFVTLINYFFEFLSLSLSFLLSLCLSALLSFPSVSVRLSLFCLHVCLSLSHSACLVVSVWLSVSVFLSVSFPHCLVVSVCLDVSVFHLSVSFTVCLSGCLCFSFLLWLSLPVWMSLCFCLSPSRSVCLLSVSFCMSVWLSLSVWRSLCFLSVCRFPSLSVWLSLCFCLSARLSLSQFIRLSFFFSCFVSLSISLLFGCRCCISSAW